MSSGATRATGSSGGRAGEVASRGEAALERRRWFSSRPKSVAADEVEFKGEQLKDKEGGALRRGPRFAFNTIDVSQLDRFAAERKVIDKRDNSVAAENLRRNLENYERCVEIYDNYPWHQKLLSYFAGGHVRKMRSLLNEATRDLAKARADFHEKRLSEERADLLEAIRSGRW